MIYSPDSKSLVYSELQFISTSVPLPQAKISADMDRIFDDVSSEIFALFVGEQEEVQSEAVWNYSALQLLPGVEVSN